ncbi:MAG: hypothetical protein MRZ79_05235 [Bacteroidia bacterium]|nr:hypothetical protein [Bacteroidia bacterium]
MDLYKIISQLREEEFNEIHSTFTANKADKSAAFLRIIRENPESPDRQFLNEFDITASAFYVLKSRLNQKIETFLLNRLGDPNLHIMRRVLNVNDLVFNNPREISVAALRRLEKELVKFDFPYGLMIIYKELQNLHSFDDNYQLYRSKYNEQVAYALAMDKAVDLVVAFFRSFDDYYLGRKDKDLNDMVRTMEKIDNLNNMYDSHRLYIFKCIIHLFAKLFIEIPDTIRCELEETEEMFDKSFEILGEYKDDTFYLNINILFNFLRFVYYENNQIRDKAKIYFEILDYKIDELLTRYHFNANTSLFLFYKLRYHLRTNTVEQMSRDVDSYVSQIEVEPYRTSFYVNYNRFLAHSYFASKQYRKTARVLYALRNEVNLRKYVHVELEVKFFLALTYVVMQDFDLANQLILSLQRQLRKDSMSRYEGNGKPLLKVLSTALGGKPNTRERNLRKYIDQFNEGNKGRYAFLKELDLEAIFLKEENILSIA